MCHIGPWSKGQRTGTSSSEPASPTTFRFNTTRASPPGDRLAQEAPEDRQTPMASSKPWLQQEEELAGNRCLEGRTGSSPLSEIGRWMVPPGGLWQLAAFHAREELSFYKTRVFSTEVGHNRALQKSICYTNPSWSELTIIP